MDRVKEWQEKISDWETSGISQAEYCRKEGISEKQFYYWKRKVTKSKKPKPKFVAVGGSSTLEVVVGKAVVRVSGNFNSEDLKRVVAALC